MDLSDTLLQVEESLVHFTQKRNNRTEHEKKRGRQGKREAAEYLICLSLAVCVTTYKRFLLHPTIHNRGMNIGHLISSHLISPHLLVGCNSFPKQSDQQQQQQN